MLYYSSQVWLSDMTDPAKRGVMQYNASLAYPPSVMSCHVSSAGNYPMEYRYIVSSFGVYGYECDVTKLSEEEKRQIRRANERYKEIADTVIGGDLYRLCCNEYYEAYLQTAKDKSKAVLTLITFKKEAGIEQAYLKLQGLSHNLNYKNSANDLVLSGATLAHAGLLISDLNCGHITNQGFRLFFNKNMGNCGGVQILFESVE